MSIEIKKFVDFYNYCHYHQEELVCPICGSNIRGQFCIGGFDMNKTGRVEFQCLKSECDFNKMNFTVDVYREK